LANQTRSIDEQSRIINREDDATYNKVAVIVGEVMDKAWLACRSIE
jgi:hypothetical protein